MILETYQLIQCTHQKNRPIASGVIKTSNALIMGVCLLLIGLLYFLLMNL